MLDATASGQETLEYLDRANLFIVPLDTRAALVPLSPSVRRAAAAAAPADRGHRRRGADEDHLRASAWYEANGLEIEAFEHAAAGHDVERAERLIEGGGMPLHFRGALVPVLHWLESLPTTVLDARPSLWVTYASLLLNWGYSDVIEPKLQAAERALQDAGTDDRTRDLVGRIASVRAFLAWRPDQVETIIAQSRRALEYLHPDNLPFRASAVFKLGHAYLLQGDRAGARQAFAEVTAMGAASGNTSDETMGSVLLGHSPDTGQSARPGGRDLPARPGAGSRPGASPCLRSPPGPGPCALPVERPRCRPTARGAGSPTGTTDSEHGHTRRLWSVPRPTGTCPGRCRRCRGDPG